ncbi:TolC family protein [Terriglobus sp.]|uniref:TolC family protein n=1 Tax=Terriglobus sp. TaxID=1889013 RepID=UPI003B00B73E
MRQSRQNSSRRVAAFQRRSLYALEPLCAVLVAGIALLTASSLHAQTPAQQVTGPTRPQAVPLSGRSTPDNPVTIMQQTAPNGASGDVNTLNTTVTVQGPYAGSVPNGPLAPDTLPLTLDAALKMALRNNLGRLSQDAGVLQAEGQRLSARSALLPNINIGAAEVLSKTNLRTVGLKTNIIPAATVFNYDDLRGVLQQTVLDLVSLHQFHGATEVLKSTQFNARNARDLIVLAVGGSYLQLTATRARLAASQAQVEYDKSVFNRARDQYDAGLAAKLDATRAEVQLETEEQRSIALQADVETQSLRLARLIGLPIGQKFVATDVYPYQPLSGYTLDTALERAMQHRLDLMAAAASIKAADAAVKAAHSEWLPNITIHADAGVAGTAPTQTALGVYSVEGIVTIPVYNGGRIQGDEKQARAAQTQRRAEYEDTRAQVDQDVRESFIQLNAAESQVRVAGRNQVLAHESLTQSVDRFIAGVTDTVEIVQAEQAVVQADDDQITALYEHNLAKLSLARAMGAAEETLPQLLRK